MGTEEYWQVPARRKTYTDLLQFAGYRLDGIKEDDLYNASIMLQDDFLGTIARMSLEDGTGDEYKIFVSYSPKNNISTTRAFELHKLLKLNSIPHETTPLKEYQDNVAWEIEQLEKNIKRKQGLVNIIESD
jgi:hypothetical protein